MVNAGRAADSGRDRRLIRYSRCYIDRYIERRCSCDQLRPAATEDSMAQCARLPAPHVVDEKGEEVG